MVRIAPQSRREVRPAAGFGTHSNALPSGGPMQSVDPAFKTNKVVDKSTSQLDRHRRHIPRKVQDSSKIFVPLNPNDVRRDPQRGKSLHTDPFAEERPHVEFRRHKVKVMTPRGPERATRRISKPVPEFEHKTKASDFVMCTGVTLTSPKRVPKDKHKTTLNDDQPAKSFFGSRRFALNPDKVAAVSGSQSQSQMLTSGTFSTSTRSISNVFPDPATGAIGSLTTSPDRRPSLKISPKHVHQVTMEGVFCPMRNGRAPKPSSLAPWLQDSHAPVTGRRAITARAQAPAPFAIEG